MSMTPIKAIRAKCLDCSEDKKEVRYCPAESCPLWPYRMGRRPKTRKELQLAQKPQLAGQNKQ